MAKKSVKKQKLDPNKPHRCEYCLKSWKNEKSLINHLCEKKMRWMDQDHKYTKIGFAAYQRFYERQQRTKVEYKDFVDSRFFRAFTKFGRYVVLIHCIDVPAFINFLITNSIKLDDWTKDTVYASFLRQETFREPAMRAVERNIHLMNTWAKETNQEWTQFFTTVYPSTAVEYIRQGRLSPWVLLTCKASAQKLFDRLSDEQIGYAFTYIDLEIWEAKLKKIEFKEDISYICKVMKQAGFEV